MTASSVEDSLVPEEDLPTSAGLSSFNLLEEGRLFAALGLAPGMTLLDLGCGLGNYALACSPRVGAQGLIHALDPWAEGIEVLEARAAMAGLRNIRPGVADAAAALPLADRSIDLCLLATVVHILVQEGVVARTLAEVRRVLRPGGTVAVVEFHKVAGPPGPPLAWRLAPAELAGVLAPSALTCSGYVDIGPYNYLARFIPQ